MVWLNLHLLDPLVPTPMQLALEMICICFNDQQVWVHLEDFLDAFSRLLPLNVLEALV